LRPGRVAVEAEHDVVGEPEQLLRVRVGRRGAERRDRVLDAVLRERDDVHVALDDDDALGVADRVPREPQPVELAPLAEQRRLGELRYFGSPLSSTRPPKPTMRPRLSWIGNMMRSRKRS
jgi:hypothetical protein